MNSWPRNVHEAAAAAATSKQPPPRVAPGRSLPRHGVDGGHGACSGHPKGSSAGNRPPRPGRPQGSPAAGEPRCTSRHGGQRRGASQPAKPQHVPSAQGGCARTACGDQQRSSPLSQLTSPLQMHLWGTCPGPQPRPPHSGQCRRSCPGMMPDLPWCRGHPAPARDPSSGSTAWWGHQRPAPAGLGERLLPRDDVTHRAQPCLQSSSQSSTRGKVWALQTWAGAAPPPYAGACRAQGQPQTAGEGTASPPCTVGMGAPQVPWSPSSHSGVQHPQQHPPAHGGAGGPAAARQQASAHASRIHPPWDPQGTRPAPAPPQTPAAFRVFSATGSRPIPWLRSCKSHIPIAAPREVAVILMHGRKGAGAAAGRVPRPDSLDRHPRAGGLGGPAGSSSEDDTRDGTVCIPARRGDPLGELR